RHCLGHGFVHSPCNARRVGDAAHLVEDDREVVVVHARDDVRWTNAPRDALGEVSEDFFAGESPEPASHFVETANLEQEDGKAEVGMPRVARNALLEVPLEEVLAWKPR